MSDLTQSRRVVVKVGSALLALEDGQELLVVHTGGLLRCDGGPLAAAMYVDNL